MQKDHLEVILEDMNHKFDIIIEGHIALDKKIDCKFNELKNDIEFLNFKIDTVNDNLTQKIDGVEVKLTGRIDAIEEKLTHRIDAVEKKLTHRIDGVEKSLGDKLDAVSSDLTAHRNDTEAHQIYQIKES
jgi:chaperonin cofactor prefoldin